MNKFLLLVLSMAILILASCGTAETKADPSKVPVESNAAQTDTSGTAADSRLVPADTAVVTKNKNISDQQKNTSGQARGPELTAAPAGNEILAHIDQYIQTQPDYQPAPAGGFTHCRLKVTNTLNDASIQKALVELKILKADGSLLRTDYYTVINIEAGGGSKLVIVPDNKQGTSMVAHIIKVKSNELTNGEFIFTGSHYVAN